MVNNGQHVTEPDFAGASQHWDVEKLYLDLARAKGKGLTPLEKTLLQGLLCGYSPAEISDKIYHDRSSSAVRVYLSNGIYRYLQKLFAQPGKPGVKIKNWSHVTRLLEKAGYRKDYPPGTATAPRVENAGMRPDDRDWEERIDIRGFLGREAELRQLRQWLVGDRYRLVAILGMAGSGKTALAAKLFEEVRGEFEVAIWRSLREHPSSESAIAAIAASLGIEPSTAGSPLSQVMSMLRSRRCLLVLDRFETVFAQGTQAGEYGERDRGYGTLLERIGGEYHASCCLVVSQERPPELEILERKAGAGRSLCLGGLAAETAQQLLAAQDLVGSAAARQHLASLYDNHPLALQLAALAIQNNFNREIEAFLAANAPLFREIRQLCDRHFERLSVAEKQVMYALAVRQPESQGRGRPGAISLSISVPERLDALASLQRRSLIHPNSFRFTYPSLFRTYLLGQLVEPVAAKVNDGELALRIQGLLWEALSRQEPENCQIV